MASLQYKKNTGKYQIRFFYNKEPHWIMLTTGDKKAATTIMNMVERRLVQMKNGEPDRVLDCGNTRRSATAIPKGWSAGRNQESQTAR